MGRLGFFDTRPLGFLPAPEAAESFLSFLALAEAGPPGEVGSGGVVLPVLLTGSLRIC